MNLFDINWQQVLAALSVAAILWGLGLVLVRANLAGKFVTIEASSDFITPATFETAFSKAAAPMTARIDRVEQAQNTAPTQSAVQEIERRVERVEAQVTEVQRTVTGVQVGVGELKAGLHSVDSKIDKVGNQIDLVVKHLLDKEA